MLKRSLFFFVALVMLTPLALRAQRSGSGTGNYATHTMAEEITELPDGSMIQLSHYHQAAFADQDDHPLNNTTADCVGMVRVSAAGAPTSGSGSCFVKDADGDGASFWWRLVEAGTTDCATMCGVWGYFAGHGKFEGITGNGTWTQSVNFPDGSTGTWTGDYRMRK